MKKSPYQDLEKQSRKAAVLSSIEGLLGWDQETYMPSDGIALRIQQTEIISALLHKQQTSPSFVKVLGKLIDLETGEILDSSLTDPQLACLREWRRNYVKESKLPSSFVKNWANTTSKAIDLWKRARRENRFSLFAPILEKIVSLSRKKADLLGFGEHPYDALLDLYEPDMKTSTIIPLFERLKIRLTSLLREIATRPPIDNTFLRLHYSPAKQMHFGHKLLHAMGFKDTFSRLDQSTHPFCSTHHPKDIRMTTRVYPDDLTANIGAVIHEGGHGLYHMGLKEEFFGTPLGEAASYGIDESQSRFWETRIGQSYPFWQHFFPLLQAEFPEQLQAIFLDDFYRAFNKVEPSLIRVESDEVSYSLHIILRFEIEKGLLEGTLKVKEIPEAWNEKMRTYLGICPASDNEGCLQDIHWAFGGIGYFPTYTLGNIYAAQIFLAFEAAHPDWKKRLASGDLAFIRNWLHEHIHRFGRQFHPEELIKRTTGKSLDETPYIDYLEKKYRTIYNL